MEESCSRRRSFSESSSPKRARAATCSTSSRVRCIKAPPQALLGDGPTPGTDGPGDEAGSVRVYHGGRAERSRRAEREDAQRSDRTCGAKNPLDGRGRFVGVLAEKI